MQHAPPKASHATAVENINKIGYGPIINSPTPQCNRLKTTPKKQPNP